MARLQTDLTDKFLHFQKESELRYISWEQVGLLFHVLGDYIVHFGCKMPFCSLMFFSLQEQVRMEKTFMEQWRLEQRQSLERWREDQRRHDKNLLNLFTKFVSETTEMVIKKSK